MRAIEFRGKAKNKTDCNCVEDNGFVYGGIAFDAFTDETYITRWNSFGLGFIENIEVDPTTVGQYTGLTDRNGRRIYEGDIVRYDFDKSELLVEFVDHGWQLRIPGEKYYKHRFEWCDDGKMIVVGNIHDNPEMLK